MCHICVLSFGAFSTLRVELLYVHIFPNCRVCQLRPPRSAYHRSRFGEWGCGWRRNCARANCRPRLGKWGRVWGREDCLFPLFHLWMRLNCVAVVMVKLNHTYTHTCLLSSYHGVKPARSGALRDVKVPHQKFLYVLNVTFCIHVQTFGIRVAFGLIPFFSNMLLEWTTLVGWSTLVSCNQLQNFLLFAWSLRKQVWCLACFKIVYLTRSDNKIWMTQEREAVSRDLCKCSLKVFCDLWKYSLQVLCT